MFLQFMRYNLVGVVNTLIGFSIIFGLMYLGVSATISNIMGYTIGLFVSYILNSRYTFTSSTNHKKVMIKFFMVLIVAYVFNFITLQWMLAWTNPYIAQLSAAVIYTVSSFLLAKYFIFEETR